MSKQTVLTVFKPWFLCSSLIVLGLDFVTKLSVVELPGPQGVALIPPYVHLSLEVNSGIFFRLLDDADFLWKPYVISGLSILAVLAILIQSMRTSADRRLVHSALGMTAGGLAGNTLDRILHGGVIDFIEVHFPGSMYYPTFNVADLAITIGLAILLAAMLAQSIPRLRSRDSRS